MRRLAVEVAQIVGPPALVGGALVSLLRGQQGGGGRWLGSLRPADGAVVPACAATAEEVAAIGEVLWSSFQRLRFCGASRCWRLAADGVRVLEAAL